ncbi:hypothetical protein ACJRO7_008963 [Eucalyptus globulus]|uniref:Heat shock factor binding protein n=1 Tax=Eucalyptus globulus TaxID=34317 RepID=A0ABD3ITI8_EUCGL
MNTSDMDRHDSEKQSTADMTAFALLNLLPCINLKEMSQSVVFFDHDALDEMGNRIDELEQSINDLKNEMGIEGSPSPAPSKQKPGEDSA